ncbi:MAG: hypothetical protein WD490_09885 [Opitutales bacterium]
MLSYTDTMLAPADSAAPMYCFRRYDAYHRDIAFQVVAVWTAATASRETSYRQAHEGLRTHQDWIRRRPTIILGDFNGENRTPTFQIHPILKTRSHDSKGCPVCGVSYIFLFLSNSEQDRLSMGYVVVTDGAAKLEL